MVLGNSLLATVVCGSIVLASTSVYAKDIYSSKEYWGFYLDSCEKLDEAMAKVRGQINEKSDVVFSNGIKFNLERMEGSLAKVAAKDKDQASFAKCREKTVKARELLSQAESYEKSVDEKQRKEARKEHEASPVYKKALELGYKDFGWLAALHSYYKEVGDDELRKWIIVVDSDCGRHYQATQYVKPYVVYTARRSQYNTCSGRERVAVLPPDGVSVNRGEYIDRDSYYVFAGLLEGKGTDGFPIKLPLLKQHKKQRK